MREHEVNFPLAPLATPLILQAIPVSGANRDFLCFQGGIHRSVASFHFSNFVAWKPAYSYFQVGLDGKCPGGFRNLPAEKPRQPAEPTFVLGLAAGAKGTSMTDIVERARSYEVGNLALQETWVQEMHELAAEIERLTVINTQLCDEKNALNRDGARLEAEIARLTHIIAHLGNERNDLKAEIERLRALLAETVPGAAREAELERLQAELDLERRRLSTSEELRTGLVAEIDRLRAELQITRDLL